MKKVSNSGPRDADIALVGEAPGVTEEMQNQPFIGSSGQELNRMLAEAGFNRQDCFITNVVQIRPPNNNISKWFYNKTEAKKLGIPEVCGRYPDIKIQDGLSDLFSALDECKPKIIIAFGDTALWALTGESGITKWRGSTLTYEDALVIPTYHPAAILRQWSWRAVALHDLRTAKSRLENGWHPPTYNCNVNPTFSEVIDYLHLIKGRLNEPFRLACDIETFRRKFISEFGIAISETDALCIPFFDVNQENHAYWDLDQETKIVWLLREILTHPNAYIVGQNWNYDMQYIAKLWGFVPWPSLDTMIAHHVLFAGLPKGLDFLSSLYNSHHVYWKDEGKEWDPWKEDQNRHRLYNCKDALATYEASIQIEKTAEKMGLLEQVDFQHKMIKPVVKAMLRGARISTIKRQELSQKLVEAMLDRTDFLNYVLDRNFNPRSTPQMRALFYNELHVKPILHKKTRKPTLGKGALGELRKKADPVIHPIIDAIVEFRRAGTAYSVTTTKIDSDNRIRCSYNIAGTETYRLSSSEDAFGLGTNLQNISKGD